MNFTSNFTDLKQVNRLAVINLIKKQPSLSRADIAKRTGLNKSTIGKIVQELLNEHWLAEELTPTSSDGGRPPTGLTLNNQVLTLMGAEIGVDYITVLACSITGELRFHSTFPYVHTHIESSVNQLADVVAHTWQLMNGLGHQVLGLGISVPGLVNAVDDKVVDLPNLGWRNLDLTAMMRERLAAQNIADIAISIINDANAAALSEFVFGQAQFSRHPIVHLTMGIGVGAGIVSENGLYRGHNGWSGEIGHSIIQPIGGLLCACGQRGCIETLISQRALSRSIQPDGALLSIETIKRRLSQGDAHVKTAIDSVGYYLGIVLHNIANILNPESIVIGGVMSQLEEALIYPAVASFQAHASRNTSRPTIRLCEFGQHASAIGAAAAILSKHLEPNGVPTQVSQKGLLRL